MKKLYLKIAVIAQVLLCLGAYFMQYFTARKMGMLRWVNGICNKWSKNMDLDRLNTVMMIIVALLAVALLFWALEKAKNRDAAFDALSVIMLSSAGLYISYTLAYTRRLMAAYYLICPLLLLGTLAVMLCFLLSSDIS